MISIFLSFTKQIGKPEMNAVVFTLLHLWKYMVKHYMVGMAHFAPFLKHRTILTENRKFATASDYIWCFGWSMDRWMKYGRIHLDWKWSSMQTKKVYSKTNKKNCISFVDTQSRKENRHANFSKWERSALETPRVRGARGAKFKVLKAARGRGQGTGVPRGRCPSPAYQGVWGRKLSQLGPGQRSGWTQVLAHFVLEWVHLVIGNVLFLKILKSGIS